MQSKRLLSEESASDSGDADALKEISNIPFLSKTEFLTPSSSQKISDDFGLYTQDGRLRRTGVVAILASLSKLLAEAADSKTEMPEIAHAAEVQHLMVERLHNDLARIHPLSKGLNTAHPTHEIQTKLAELSFDELQKLIVTLQCTSRQLYTPKSPLARFKRWRWQRKNPHTKPNALLKDLLHSFEVQALSSWAARVRGQVEAVLYQKKEKFTQPGQQWMRHFGIGAPISVIINALSKFFHKFGIALSVLLEATFVFKDISVSDDGSVSKGRSFGLGVGGKLSFLLGLAGLFKGILGGKRFWGECFDNDDHMSHSPHGGYYRKKVSVKGAKFNEKASVNEATHQSEAMQASTDAHGVNARIEDKILVNALKKLENQKKSLEDLDKLKEHAHKDFYNFKNILNFLDLDLKRDERPQNVKWVPPPIKFTGNIWTRTGTGGIGCSIPVWMTTVDLGEQGSYASTHVSSTARVPVGLWPAVSNVDATGKSVSGQEEVVRTKRIEALKEFFYKRKWDLVVQRLLDKEEALSKEAALKDAFENRKMSLYQRTPVYKGIMALHKKYKNKLDLYNKKIAEKVGDSKAVQQEQALLKLMYEKHLDDLKKSTYEAYLNENKKQKYEYFFNDDEKDIYERTLKELDNSLKNNRKSLMALQQNESIAPHALNLLCTDKEVFARLSSEQRSAQLQQLKALLASICQQFDDYHDLSDQLSTQKHDQEAREKELKAIQKEWGVRSKYGYIQAISMTHALIGVHLQALGINTEVSKLSPALFDLEGIQSLDNTRSLESAQSLDNTQSILDDFRKLTQQLKDFAQTRDYKNIEQYVNFYNEVNSTEYANSHVVEINTQIPIIDTVFKLGIGGNVRITFKTMDRDDANALRRGRFLQEIFTISGNGSINVASLMESIASKLPELPILQTSVQETLQSLLGTAATYAEGVFTFSGLPGLEIIRNYHEPIEGAGFQLQYERRLATMDSLGRARREVLKEEMNPQTLSYALLRDASFQDLTEILKNLGESTQAVTTPASFGSLEIKIPPALAKSDTSEITLEMPAMPPVSESVIRLFHEAEHWWDKTMGGENVLQEQALQADDWQDRMLQDDVYHLYVHRELFFQAVRNYAADPCQVTFEHAQTAFQTLVEALREHAQQGYIPLYKIASAP